MTPIKYPKKSRPIKAKKVTILAFFSMGFDAVFMPRILKNYSYTEDQE